MKGERRQGSEVGQQFVSWEWEELVISACLEKQKVATAAIRSRRLQTVVSLGNRVNASLRLQ